MDYTNDVNYTFKKETKDYKQDLNPIKTSKEQIKLYIEKVYKIPKDISDSIASKIIKDNKPKNPIVTYNNKNEVGDMEKTTTTLSNYLKDTIEDNNIIVPSFTNYTHPSKKLSMHSDFLIKNVALRKKDKHQAFVYELNGDLEKYMYFNTMSNIRKIFNNSVSGAYGSKGTILSNFSAHYTLTSITRCMSSIGNITTESIVAGNKYFKDPDTTINYVIAVIHKANRNMIHRVVDKFKLYVPTADECMEMILYSSRWYWKDIDKENTIFNLINTLQDYELTALMYTNDLWHFKKYNEDVTRDIIKGMSSKYTNLSDNPVDELYKAPEGIGNLVHLVCSDDIKGINIDYKKLVNDDPKLLDLLASTSNGICKTMDKYWLFFKAFFVTDILPTSIAYVKDMLRDSIVLSDTDSTCGSYDRWVEWYYGDYEFHSGAVGVAGAVMTINSQVMDHFIKVFCANMNIDKSNYEVLKMKNEFYWHVFVATNAGKHYYANTYIQEGNVFKEDKLERKGVHLIASSIKKDLQKMTKDILEEILETVKTKQPISLKKWVDRCAQVELEIIDTINKGDVSIFKTNPIKEAKAYKDVPERSPFKHHIWWNKHFGDKYGNPPEPPYTSVKIPLNLNNRTDVNNWLESITDIEIRNSLIEWNKNRTALDFKTFWLPLPIADRIGIPEEFRKVINVKRIISDNLQPFYMVLESLGFYKKPTLCIYESTGYSKEENEQ